MSDLKQTMAKELKAFNNPKYFITDILQIDWLFDWQMDTFVDFYKDDYMELVSCVGQRCLHPDTKILTGDGTYKKVENIDDGEVLYGIDFKDGKIKKDKCFVYKNKKEKELVEIEVWTGKKLKVTKDHKIYTQRGLVEAQNLTGNDYVYIPYETVSDSISDKHQAKILGYMIGDGSLEKHNLPKKLKPIINGECFFDKVVSVDDCCKSETYDIWMPHIGNFFAEDILVKNSGKTLLASLFATYELFKMLAVGKPNTYFGMPKGSDIFIINVATNQQQAKDTVFSEIESRIENCDWFKNQNFKKRSREYEFFTEENSIFVRAEHSNSASIAGHTSKCIAEGSRVITSNGYKKIENINKNDKVQDIELENINQKFDNGKKDVVKIKTSKGYSLECTKDHKIIVYKENIKDNYNYGEYPDYSFEYMEAGDILDNKEDNIHIPILLNGAELLNNEYKEIGSIKFPLNFDLGYILGYFIGDGTFGGNGNSGYCIYVNKDKFKNNLVEKIENYCGTKPTVGKCKNKNATYGKSDLYRIRLTYFIRHIINELIDKNQRLKHKKAEVFDIIYESNEKCIIGFLSGLFDADGSFSSRYEANYTMKNKNFAEEIQDLLRLCGIYSKIYHNNKKDNNYYTVRVSGNALKVLKEKLDTLKNSKYDIKHNELNFPKNIVLNSKNRDRLSDYRKNGFTSKSNAKKVLKDDEEFNYKRYLDNDFLFDKVQTIEEIGEKEVYDLEVNTDRHEYTVNGFKVHNCVILDELARFKTTGGERSASLVYETLKRTLATFGKEGKIISISSPLYKDDFMMQLLRHGKNVDSVMTVHKPTWECNPNIKMEDLQMEFDRNPESAWRDFGAQPPESLEAYFKEPHRIENCVEHGVPQPVEEFMLPDIEPINEPCYLAGDPAYKNDRFGLALAYRDDDEDIIRVPLAHSFQPRGKDVSEIDAKRVVDYIVKLIETHNVVKFYVDIWNYPSALQKIRQNGVMVEQNTVQKEEYDTLKEKIYTGEISLPPNDLLVKELKQLELINGQKVDHPKKGSKDIADAVANAVYNCFNDTDNAVEPMAMVID